MAPLLWLPGTRARIVADYTSTGGQCELIEGYLCPGMQTSPHRHTRYSEQLCVLNGEVTVWTGEHKAVLTAGETFYIAPGTPHIIGVFTDVVARGLLVAALSSFARLITAVGTVDEAELPNMALSIFQLRLATIFWGQPGALPAATVET